MDTTGYRALTLYCFIALLAVAFIVLGVRKSRAYEISEGTGVVCDTREQIERFAALEMQLEALRVINVESNVCVMAEVRYIYGHEASRVRMSESTVQVIEILVLQFKMHGSWLSIPPVVQYTLFQIKEEDA